MKKLQVWLLITVSVIIIILTPTVFYGKITANNFIAPKEYKGILRLWHIDSFEGGTGSRADFLAARAREYEKNNVGQLILVTSHTIESATEALRRGSPPDLISYGAGFSLIASYPQPLNNFTFKGGEIAGETFSYPWCRGGYALFSRNEIDIDNLNGKAVIGGGGHLIALAMSGLNLDFDIKDSYQAYIDFLNGKYDYFLGTQRDIFRFDVRHMTVHMHAINAYSDLYQYISVLSSEPLKAQLSKKFISFLLSEKSQEKLKNIYMVSALQSGVYGGDFPLMQRLESAKIQSTISAFMTDENYAELNKNALLMLRGDSLAAKKVRNSLIYI